MLFLVNVGFELHVQRCGKFNILKRFDVKLRCKGNAIESDIDIQFEF
jgi:hypothetical protein